MSSLLHSPPNVKVGERELVPRGAGLPPRDRRFESCSLRQQVRNEPCYGFKLDLGEQDPFFKKVYAAARRVGWGRTTSYGALTKELG